MQHQHQHQLFQARQKTVYKKQNRTLPFDRNDYFNSKELAVLFNVSNTSIHENEARGDFLHPTIVSPRKHYWKKHDVFVWMANNQDSYLLRNLDL